MEVSNTMVRVLPNRVKPDTEFPLVVFTWSLWGYNPGEHKEWALGINCTISLERFIPAGSNNAVETVIPINKESDSGSEGRVQGPSPRSDGFYWIGDEYRRYDFEWRKLKIARPSHFRSSFKVLARDGNVVAEDHSKTFEAEQMGHLEKLEGEHVEGRGVNVCLPGYKGPAPQDFATEVDAQEMEDFAMELEPFTGPELEEHFARGYVGDATVLSAAVFYPAKNRDVLEKLAHEIRSTFSDEKDIDMTSVQKLPYKTAVLNEAMRMYPPVVSGSPRTIAKGGETVMGRHVPQGTNVSVWHWCMFHNSDYFALPDEFIPERWTGDERFANDNKDAFQPFSYGARNCLGQTLAYTEMRLILARLIWNFDLKLDKSSENWEEESKSYFMWDKGPLNVSLALRAGCSE